MMTDHEHQEDGIEEELDQRLVDAMLRREAAIAQSAMGAPNSALVPGQGLDPYALMSFQQQGLFPPQQFPAGRQAPGRSPWIPVTAILSGTAVLITWMGLSSLPGTRGTAENREAVLALAEANRALSKARPSVCIALWSCGTATAEPPAIEPSSPPSPQPPAPAQEPIQAAAPAAATPEAAVAQSYALGYQTGLDQAKSANLRSLDQAQKESEIARLSALLSSPGMTTADVGRLRALIDSLHLPPEEVAQNQ
ncbi:MAG TPA: hypothetical protein V6D29_13180 [Leptolyngbyaceae cyanobacterium]